MGRKRKYNDIFLVLDIETSKFKSDRIGQYQESFKNEFAYSTTTYLWGVKSYNYNEMIQDINAGQGEYKPFRTFEELDSFMHSFDNESQLTLCYIHNAPYEMSFIIPHMQAKYGLNNIFKIENDTISSDSMLGDSFRKPFKVSFTVWPKIEFRCSYKMLNKSLEKVGAGLGIDKHLYKNNYDDIYTSASVLPESELLYNESDLDITAKGIVREFSKGNIFNAITTSQLSKVYSSTSFCKLNIQEYMTFNGVRQMAKDLRGNKPRNRHWYNTINICYVGGYTHANFTKINEVLEGVYSADLTSAYP